jgi:hypothetical protein
MLLLQVSFGLVCTNVRIFDFSEVVAEVNHISIGGVFGGLSLGPWLGIN